ncbi:hypothetical protein GGR58DRAFT_473393 [Xylaria digitata]|nr:hypothetical protein GGR58DRAFT_473393 [Xylaria digitata]
MSLGVKLLWRAQPCISLVQRLSLGPRGFRHLSFTSTLQARCRLSTSTEPSSTAGGLEPPSLQTHKIGEGGDRAIQDEATERPLRSASALARMTSIHPDTARGRLILRRKMKDHVPSSRASPMIKRAIQYPSRRASYLSWRKHVVSKRKQALHEIARDALGKTSNDDWRSILDFMIRHTPKFGEILDFKVGIGKGAAMHARATLSELDTNLWQIGRKHHCKIRVESGLYEDGPLILSLSGTSVSVRESLLELVRTVGKVAAVRVLDQTLHVSLPENWEGSAQGQLPIQLLRDGESAAEDETVTVYGHTTGAVEMASMAPRPKYKLYQLTTRADDIPRPIVWTKSSFEQYVAKLVFGRVPTHLQWSLYPVGLDHQTTVVHLLTKLFTSEDLRAAWSVSALKLALQYILLRGTIFRPAARTISYQAELQHLPLDAETFQTFLDSAARAGDLSGFKSVLKAMYRKGHYFRAETWTAFLGMIQDPRIKSYIMRRMKSRDLHRLRPILEEFGRQTVMLDLESRIDTVTSIQRLLEAQDKQYGPSWLDRITFNKMINVLGAHGKLGLCHELLDLVDHDQRVRPDHYTLNTMMTHTKSIPQKIALLSRWPKLGPDGVTYQLLFQTAWKQRLPNMLRVIWRYGVFANLTNSKMRHTLMILMHPELELSSNRAFLKAWEDVILGRDELIAGRLQDTSGAGRFGTVHLMKRYMEDAGGRRPLIGLETKLREAYDMDMRIHKLNKERVEMSSSMRESLTVDIPLGIVQTQKEFGVRRIPS